MQRATLKICARAAIALAAAAAFTGANAQQVRLRLAASLCSSMTGQVLTSQQVPPLSSSAPAGSSVNAALADRMEQQRDSYFARLDAVVPFKGLYATGMTDQSFAPNEGGRYSFGLEWELYDQGRGEARRTLERLKLESKTHYVQLLRDMEQRQLQENLLAVEQMRNKLLALLYQREAGAIRPVLERRKQELAAGRATRGDVAEVEYKAERAALRAQHYTGLGDVLVYPQAQELINQIEDVQLQPDAELLERAVARSADFRLQQLLAERNRFLPSVKDNTSVRLYVERSKDFERGPYTVAGVRLRVPIGNDEVRDAVAAASQGMFQDQQDSIRAALAQKLALLSERLRLKQNDMRLLQAENRMVRQKAELACYRLDHPISSLPDSDRDVEELTLRLHELQREILTARLEVLDVLTQVSALVKPRQPQELYSLRAH
ncbi:MAG: hypothetical protein JWP65_743 [Ramlibacter sp.]|jgi:hypothetical protein|uniref:hypothetical protein n=1 Tax=Ramlibacter sp. TaxID=1917967 RepID=UPI0026268982|nr:hypothetical protein [Ramlibacter sp.]MDB5750322.1 hypothetical protein [Ramlibacter sp.]